MCSTRFSGTIELLAQAHALIVDDATLVWVVHDKPARAVADGEEVRAGAALVSGSDADRTEVASEPKGLSRVVPAKARTHTAAAVLVGKASGIRLNRQITLWVPAQGRDDRRLYFFSSWNAPFQSDGGGLS